MAMQLMLVAVAAAMSYPEEAGAPVFAEAILADDVPLAEGETVDKRSHHHHHHHHRPSYGSKGN